MTITPIIESQRKAAKVVGFTYLFSNALCILSEFLIRSNIIVWGNPAKTAANIVAHGQLFRLGIATELTAFASLAVLVAALYAVLEPVNRNLALLASFWRLIEIAICVGMTLTSFDLLRFAGGADYMRPFDTDRLQALASRSIVAHGEAYTVGIFIFGLGSTVFSYLWFKSRYIPKALAGWGIFSSLLAAVCTLAFVVYPRLGDTLSPGCFLPILVFETAIALWLLTKGLPTTQATEAETAGG
jgi:hypothetical protein